jgi:hypothetical protein
MELTMVQNEIQRVLEAGKHSPQTLALVQGLGCIGAGMNAVEASAIISPETAAVVADWSKRLMVVALRMGYDAGPE